MKDKAAVIDVDGSYLCRKQQQLNCQLPLCDLPLPGPPLCGWESVTVENVHEKCLLIPRVMPGLLYGCEVVLCSHVQLL